ncbi:hypothetical protein FB45DRAFT_1105487 [Roridomyces roridus]|uniref:Uncharacterized protein n=1 Tax=Roridomyces roridus TaxID=1738132 RepID=A0AAD7BBS3_9AGAR|nr:hypothetical protein FB45DRAFT_1105487 [Roridomyces roridus]
MTHMAARSQVQLLAQVTATPSRPATAIHPAILRVLHAVWLNVPDTIDLGIIELFLSHLQVDKIGSLCTPKHPGTAGPLWTLWKRYPKIIRSETVRKRLQTVSLPFPFCLPKIANGNETVGALGWQLDADFAHLSLSGLSGMRFLLDNPSFPTHAKAVISGLLGIIEWCQYLFDASASPGCTAPKRRRSALAEYPGCLELTTKLWASSDIYRDADVAMARLRPIPALVLSLLLEETSTFDKDDAFARMIQASGGDATFVAQVVLRQVKKCTKDLGNTSARS